MSQKEKSGLCCTFCDKSQDLAKKLIAGPGVYICDGCVDAFSAEARAREPKDKGDQCTGASGPAMRCSFCSQAPHPSKSCSSEKGTICLSCLDLCNEILVEEKFDQVPRPRLTDDLVSGSSGAGQGRRESRLKCSFCGKSQDQVDKLIAGPGVYICNKCFLLCEEILKAEAKERAGALVGQASGAGAGSAEVATAETASAEVASADVASNFDGRIATGDVATFKAGDFVVCQVLGEQDGSYKVMVLTSGPQASLASTEKLLSGAMVLAKYVGKQEGNIVLVDYQP